MDRFVRERTPEWQELERLLSRAEAEGMRSLGVSGARRLGRLYRGVSADLVRARTELADASVVDHLNDLVARAYASVHAGRATGGGGRRLLGFFIHDFPRTVRQEWRPILLSGVLLASGALFGAVSGARDPASVQVTIPDMFQHDPAERVARDESRGGESGDPAVFSTWLFTHNTQVTFTVFALGLTFGIGTVGLLLYNGAPLGALAWQYHQAGHDLFFWAWILPHGIPELTVVAIAGGAGLIVGRGMWLPGRRRRRDALVAEARTAVRLVVGAMPLLLLAGLIEGTISQIHEPRLPYELKLLFAAVVGGGVYAFLLRGGRSPSPQPASGTDGAGQAMTRASARRSSMTRA